METLHVADYDDDDDNHILYDDDGDDDDDYCDDDAQSTIEVRPMFSIHATFIMMDIVCLLNFTCFGCTHQTHCGMHASICSHTQTTTGADSLVYARAVGSEQARTYEGPPIISGGFETAAGVRGLNVQNCFTRPFR